MDQLSLGASIVDPDFDDDDDDEVSEDDDVPDHLVDSGHQNRRATRVGPRPKVLAGRDLIRMIQLWRGVDPKLLDDERPLKRADCKEGHRPCPFVGCRHHLYLNVTSTGSIVFSFPDKEPGDMDESCALDVAEKGGVTLEEVGEHTNLTRERIRQLEGRGMERVKVALQRRDDGTEKIVAAWPATFRALRSGDEED